MSGKVLPKYYQVEQLLRRRIAQLQPGDALPSEPEMSSEYAVSRSTLRAAVDVLARDGLLLRVQGRGTFVAKQKLEFPLGYPRGSGDAGADERSVHEVIRFSRYVASPECQQLFGLSPTDKVLEVVRLTRLDDVPMGIGTLSMPATLVSGARRADFDHGRFFYTLADLGVKIARHRLSIESVVIQEELAEMIGVRPGLPGLGLTRTGYSLEGAPLAVVHIVTRGDNAKYVMELNGGVVPDEFHASLH